MHKLMTRYLDGELGEDEATQFIEELERDADLAAELQAHERILAAGRSLGSEHAPSGFTDRLMAKLPRTRHAPASPRRFALVSRPVWAAAAVVVFAFGLGRLTSNLNRDDSVTSQQNNLAVRSSISAQPIAFVTAAAEAQNLRLVQMTYVPGEAGAESVSMAGTFNGWKADMVPMREKDGVWTAVLVLPPGSYEYMFVEDGERWVTDPLAPRTRDDGFGGRNAVLDLGV
jgi:anti-sigma factor RsiW